MEIKSANCAPELQSALPRPIHARRPALKLAAHLPLRGDSAIKLAAGNNPNITISIFAMPTAPARARALGRALGRGLGRPLTGIGSTKLAVLSLHPQIGLFHF